MIKGPCVGAWWWELDLGNLSFNFKIIFNWGLAKMATQSFDRSSVPIFLSDRAGKIKILSPQLRPIFSQ